MAIRSPRRLAADQGEARWYDDDCETEKPFVCQAFGVSTPFSITVSTEFQLAGGYVAGAGAVISSTLAQVRANRVDVNTAPAMPRPRIVPVCLSLWCTLALYVRERVLLTGGTPCCCRTPPCPKKISGEDGEIGILNGATLENSPSGSMEWTAPSAVGWGGTVTNMGALTFGGTVSLRAAADEAGFFPENAGAWPAVVNEGGAQVLVEGGSGVALEWLFQNEGGSMVVRERGGGIIFLVEFFCRRAWCGTVGERAGMAECKRASRARCDRKKMSVVAVTPRFYPIRMASCIREVALCVKR